MAVYTDITESELAALLGEYEIGRALSFQGIAEGVENSNYVMHTERGKFILTLYEKRVNPQDLPFFLALKQHLAAQGLKCPVPVARKDGGLLSEICGRPAAIISFLAGRPVRRPQAAHCFALGRAMAQLHLAGQNFPQQRANDLSVPHWGDMFNTYAQQADAIHPAMSREMGEVMQSLTQDWPQDLPRGIIHADLFIDNVFFTDDALSGIIDFYFACTDMFAYDMAITFNAWCFEADINFNITKARAIFEGYQSVRPMAKDEIAALPMLATGAAMRFLLTRLQDWLTHDEAAFVRPKDPLDYFRRLRFHRTAKTPEDYGIIAS